MLKQVYKLNLPPVNEIFKETFTGYNDDAMSYNYVIESDISKIIKPEWQSFLNFNWNRLLYFKKNNTSGSVHTDATSPDTKKIDYDITVWGINWVIGGVGVMDFWNFDGVQDVGFTPSSLNNPNFGIVHKYKPITTPLERHVLYPNTAYLINATLPHQAQGVGPRKVYSMRTDVCNMPWEDVVATFAKYIDTQ